MNTPVRGSLGELVVHSVHNIEQFKSNFLNPIFYFSVMMKDITSFLPVVLWQGFLRPIDLRIEIETFNEDLQVQGSTHNSVSIRGSSGEPSASLWPAFSFNVEFAYGLLLYEFYHFFYNRSSWDC